MFEELKLNQFGFLCLTRHVVNHCEVTALVDFSARHCVFKDLLNLALPLIRDDKVIWTDAW